MSGLTRDHSVATVLETLACATDGAAVTRTQATRADA